VQRALGTNPGVTYLPGTVDEARPATAIRSFTELFDDLLDQGAGQVRVVGDVPHPGTGGRWEEWRRYEAAVNQVFADLPVWGLCPYDTRCAPPHVIADVLSMHSHIASVDGHAVNHAYVEPLEAAARPLAIAEPLCTADPAVVLRGPSPAQARRAAHSFATEAGLGPRTADLLLIVSELVTNAHRHGVPPVTVELCADDDRIVVAVTDAGTGPADPFAGLVDPGASQGGRGLWIVEQISSATSARRQPRAFTFSAAVPTPAAAAEAPRQAPT
jgi:anti-sigma regulatory factor (Ser/Thr protein kinase)